MQHEMTDQQLSERVCRALGIEPGYEVAGYEIFRTKSDAEELAGTFLEPPEIYPIYPSVLDWPGFGRVVDRLKERNMPFTMQHFTDPYPNRYGVRVNYMKTCHADTLPRALALAVVAWEASRG